MSFNTSSVVGVFFNLVTSSSAVYSESWTSSGTESVLLWGGQVENRQTVTAYTPTTTQPITNYIPVLQTAPAGVARFDHNPITRESLGLLVEESRTNLLTYSEQFDNNTWDKGNSFIQKNIVVAPDGSLTGDKLVENTLNGIHITQVFSPPSFTSGLSYTFSIYVKAAGRYKGLITLARSNVAFGSVVAASFNLQSRTITGVTGSPTLDITQIGNDWFRLSITKTAIATTTELGLGIRCYNDAGSSTYTGDGFSGIYIWGAQLEVGAFPTSYIKTEATAVTRFADDVSMVGNNFSNWYNQTEGSFYAEADTTVNISSTINRVNTITLFHAQTAYLDNSIIFGPNGVGGVNSISLFVNVSNVAQVNNVLTLTEKKYKGAFSYKVNNFQLAKDGVVSAIDTIGSVPAINTLLIGSRPRDQYQNGCIRKIAYYPVHLSSDFIQALTK